jgi:hypothetical protein
MLPTSIGAFLSEIRTERKGVLEYIRPVVVLNLVQDPWSNASVARAVNGAPWMLNQVQHDG